MGKFEDDAKAFGAQKAAFAGHAQQIVAVRLLCGIDLTTALTSQGEERLRCIRALERAIERERQKGTRRHWSYDLNRHIALKQALDALKQERKTHVSQRAGRFAQSINQSGATRRR